MFISFPHFILYKIIIYKIIKLLCLLFFIYQSILILYGKDQKCNINLQKKPSKPIGVLLKNAVYKPFRYEWAIEYWSRQQSFFWLPEEIPLDRDAIEFVSLDSNEKYVLIQILRFFTQTDIEVANLYVDYYLPFFKATEIRMMLLSFANMETIHIHSYQMLISTLGLPDIEFSIFLEYEAMKNKYDYMQNFATGTPEDTAINLAIVSGLLEGTVLFASFTILLHFSKNRAKPVMNGLGNIIAFSMRDETLHCLSIIHLYHIYIQEQMENKSNFDIEKVHKIFIENLHIVIKNEINFIHLCFAQGEIPGLKPEEVIDYIKYICNRRCTQLNIEIQFPEIKHNPLPWVDEAIGLSVTNFFNGTPSDYAKSSAIQNWDDIFTTNIT